MVEQENGAWWIISPHDLRPKDRLLDIRKPRLTVGTYSLGNLLVVYEIRRQVCGGRSQTQLLGNYTILWWDAYLSHSSVTNNYTFDCLHPLGGRLRRSSTRLASWGDVRILISPRNTKPRNITRGLWLGFSNKALLQPLNGTGYTKGKRNRIPLDSDKKNNASHI